MIAADFSCCLVIFIYYQVVSFEIAADIFMSLESTEGRVKNISLYFKRGHLVSYLLSNHKI